jgi:hypothetical protein
MQLLPWGTTRAHRQLALCNVSHLSHLVVASLTRVYTTESKLAWSSVHRACGASQRFPRKSSEDLLANIAQLSR